MVEYRAVSWTPSEMVGGDKMNQLSENIEWLYNNSPRVLYTQPGGLTRAEGVKIMAGRSTFPKNNKRDSGTRRVNFGNFFSANTRPCITTGVISEQPRTTCAIQGIGSLLPNNLGFIIRCNIDADLKKNDKILKTFYVDWHAMGI